MDKKLDSSVCKHWFAIYTKPRCEKKVAQDLLSKGFETYLPLISTLRQWTDRKKKVKVPLISSYVFVFVSEKERSMVLEHPHVLNFVFWLGKPATIPLFEIDRLKKLLENSFEEFSIESFQPGDTAFIAEGQFKSEEVEWIGEEKRNAVVLLKSLGVLLKVSKHVVQSHK